MKPGCDITDCISAILKGPINYLCFHFLCPVVTEFDKGNAYFQATNIDANELVKQLHCFYESFTGRVYNKNGHALPVDFRGKFILEATNLIKNNSIDCATIMKVNEAKGNAFQCLKISSKANYALTLPKMHHSLGNALQCLKIPSKDWHTSILQGS